MLLSSLCRVCHACSLYNKDLYALLICIYCKEYSIILSSVPQPGVDITLNHTSLLYAGSGLTLTCTVTLDPNVNNGERVMTDWSGLQDIPQERYSVTGTSGSGSTYTDSLTISPLADQDDGTYTCTVIVTGGNNVQQATSRDDVTITVMGEIVQPYFIP